MMHIFLWEYKQKHMQSQCTSDIKYMYIKDFWDNLVTELFIWLICLHNFLKVLLNIYWLKEKIIKIELYWHSFFILNWYLISANT